ncbi:hypothetical protein RFI_14713, partial [Reticulomyxa filosa]
TCFSVFIFIFGRYFFFYEKKPPVFFFFFFLKKKRVIATPGRLCYLIKETHYSLKAVEVVVFDEADRLFEMGFALQLRAILNQMPKKKQVLLYSATMPQSLLEFTRASLSNPVVIRLDTDMKLSPHLQMAYVFTRSDVEKMSALVFLITKVLKWSPSSSSSSSSSSKSRQHYKSFDDSEKESMRKKSGIIFTATRYHCEMVQYLLQTMNDIPCHCVYGTMEQCYRKENIEDFRAKKVPWLVVTDVAARGIDIPMLDYVINYHMPSEAKLFIHRVGRVARAGQTGEAWSLVSTEELPYLTDVCRLLQQDLPLKSEFAAAAAAAAALNQSNADNSSAGKPTDDHDDNDNDNDGDGEDYYDDGDDDIFKDYSMRQPEDEDAPMRTRRNTYHNDDDDDNDDNRNKRPNIGSGLFIQQTEDVEEMDSDDNNFRL